MFFASFEFTRLELELEQLAVVSSAVPVAQLGDCCIVVVAYGSGQLLIEVEGTVLEIEVQKLCRASSAMLATCSDDVNCCSKLFQLSVEVPLNCGRVMLGRFAMF